MDKKSTFIIVVLIILVIAIGFYLINKSSQGVSIKPKITLPKGQVNINQPSGNFKCEAMYDEIENDLDRANYCEDNSDCDVIMLGGWYVDFGCYHFINKNVDQEQFFTKMEVYKQKCSKIINECAPVPEATCVSKKCIYVDRDSCDKDHPELCDRSCKINSDCKQACPIGCINIDQSYPNPKNLDCTQFLCKCTSNECQPFWGKQ